MDYTKIAKFAEDLEKAVCGGEEEQKPEEQPVVEQPAEQPEENAVVNELNKRTEDEKEEEQLPEPPLEAGEFDEDTTVEGCDDAKKKASIQKLIHLAGRVRQSSMSFSDKKLAMSKIAKARKALDGDAEGAPVINKKMLNEQNRGTNNKKVREIYQKIEKIKGIKPMTLLGDLNVKLQVPVSKLTVRQLLNILNDIADQA